jgi:hypothetical protein
MKGHREVGFRAVGHLAPAFDLRAMLHGPGQDGEAVAGLELRSRRLGHPVDDVGLGNSGRREDTGIRPAVPGVEEDRASLKADRDLACDPLADLSFRARTDATPQPLQRGERGVAGDAVGRYAAVPLEFVHGLVRLGSEDAVFLSRVEPERIQTALQLADVVPTHGGPTQVERPGADRQARFDELPPCLLRDHSVGAEPSPDLEDLHRGLRMRPEVTAFRTGDGISKRDEPCLNIKDGAAGITDFQGRAGGDGHRVAS